MTKPETEKLPNAEDGDFDCPKAAACRVCLCGFCKALRAQGGGDDLEECRRHSCKRKAVLRGATPDAAPDAVTDAMVNAALDAMPFKEENSALRVWQCIESGCIDTGGVMRAALTAAIAHARSAGGDSEAR